MTQANHVQKAYFLPWDVIKPPEKNECENKGSGFDDVEIIGILESVDDFEMTYNLHIQPYRNTV